MYVALSSFEVGSAVLVCEGTEPWTSDEFEPGDHVPVRTARLWVRQVEVMAESFWPPVVILSRVESEVGVGDAVHPDDSIRLAPLTLFSLGHNGDLCFSYCSPSHSFIVVVVVEIGNVMERVLSDVGVVHLIDHHSITWGWPSHWIDHSYPAIAKDYSHDACEGVTKVFPAHSVTVQSDHQVDCILLVERVEEGLEENHTKHTSLVSEGTVTV